MEMTPLQILALIRKANELKHRVSELECIICTLTDSDSRILRNLELAFVFEEEINNPHGVVPKTREITVSQKLMLLRLR